ncbi:MAG: YceI family protein [Candidatus Paceibacterota bacterium]|jgi:polyisoprenoid-binding protein YceI
MKKFLYFVVALIIVAIGIYFFATRPVEAPPAVAPAGEVPSESETGVVQKWSIDPANSTAKFEIDEELRGEPFHVVGQTKVVSGDVSYDATNGKVSGLISIDGATLKTDSSQRDGAIGRFILHTEDADKRFITFALKEVTTIPPDPVLDTSYTFTVRGTLTINGISKEVSWTMTGKAAAGGTITGTAKTTVKRGDFGLTIPNIPFVANVSENVGLILDFVFLKK